MKKQKFHEIDRHPTKRGCVGIETCESCQMHAATIAGKLEPGMCVVLPFHYLFVWTEDTFTLLPKFSPSMN